jgi:hypothetical protein
MSIQDALQKTLNYLRRRKRDYQLAFMSPAGQEVLLDLAKFCRADRTTFNADPRIHAALEGRREVWLRIQQHLGLTPEQLLVLYSGATIQPSSGAQDNG